MSGKIITQSSLKLVPLCHLAKSFNLCKSSTVIEQCHIAVYALTGRVCAQGTQIQAQGSSPRAKGGILRRPGMGGSADDLERLPYKGNAPNSPTVSWHRSVTDKEIHRRPPLSNIFPTAAPSPRYTAC